MSSFSFGNSKPRHSPTTSSERKCDGYRSATKLLGSLTKSSDSSMSRGIKRGIPPLLALPPKRSRRDETAYSASIAKSVLVRQGMAVPRIRYPRMLPPGCNIDLSSVQLVNSPSVEESPFLSHSTVDSSADIFNNCAIISSMVTSNRSHYGGGTPAAPPSETSNVETASKAESNSMSSLTDTDSAKDSNNDDEESNGVATLNVPSISIGGGFPMSARARVVTLGEDPFIIVHVNQAFSRLTGFSLFRVVGQPLRDFMDEDSAFGDIKMCSDTHATTTLGRQCMMVKTTSKIQKYVTVDMAISPVGISPYPTTHLVMHVQPSLAGPTRILSKMTASAAVGLQVMG